MTVVWQVFSFNVMTRSAVYIGTTRRGIVSVADRLGVDKKNRPRAIFFYDGICGSWKFFVGFVLDRDKSDHMRFSPLQTEFATQQCKQYQMPTDLSTGVLIDEKGAHRDSTAILRILPYMGFPYTMLGPLSLLVPTSIRDLAYFSFARNRGFIWKQVKRITGMGDTQLDEYIDRILGLKEPLDPRWGFKTTSSRWLGQ